MIGGAGPDAAADHQRGQETGRQLAAQAVEKGLARGHGGELHPRRIPGGSRRSSGPARGGRPVQRGGQRRLLRRAGLQPSQQGQEEGKRPHAVELHALPLQGPDPTLHLPAAKMELLLDGTGAHVQQLRNLLHAQVLIIPHAEHELLLRGQLPQDLPHQASRLLPVEGRLRLAGGVRVRQLGQGCVLLAQLRKADGLSLRRQPRRFVHRDPPQPEQEGLVGLQPVEAPEGPQPGILQNVPDQVLIPDHGPNGAVEGGVGLLVQRRKGRLVPAPGQAHQRGVDLRPGRSVVGSLFHCFSPVFLSRSV